MQAALEAAGWNVLRRDGEKATREEVLRLLQEEDLALLHYIGHGYRMGTGPDANGSYLSLGGEGKKLSLPDVLALRRAPERVFLSNCEGDAAGEGMLVAGMGMAPAFVISGATTAIAMTGSPGDAHMAALVSELYENHISDLLTDPAVALRDTVKALRAGQGTSSVVFPALRVSTR